MEGQAQCLVYQVMPSQAGKAVLMEFMFSSWGAGQIGAQRNRQRTGKSGYNKCGEGNETSQCNSPCHGQMGLPETLDQDRPGGGERAGRASVCREGARHEVYKCEGGFTSALGS